MNYRAVIKEGMGLIHVLDDGGPKLMGIWKCEVCSKYFCRGEH
jgi:hypothetical protein